MSTASQGCPLLAAAVPAGFPSPAADYAERHLSLDAHLIEHPEATFFVRVSGSSMSGFGILDHDILVVDRAGHPASGSIVIAVIDGDFVVKQYCPVAEGVLLRAGAPGHPDILVGEEQELVIWGVVRWAIHKI